MSALKSLAWEGESLRLLDQTKLPSEITYLNCTDYREVADAIRILAVRGAPAIGVAAAYAVLLAYRECLSAPDVSTAFHYACEEISAARPTAVNLSWAVSEMEKVFARYPAKEAGDALLSRAKEIEAEDIHTCRSIGENGADLFHGRKGLRILTHCNTGALATAGIGTAFGVLSVLAAYHHIPFYIAAPFSTFDFSISSGKEIVIEERNPDEVRKLAGVYTAPKDVPVYNPAFDVTPSSLIAGIITEKGVLKAPYEETIARYKKELSK